MNPVSSHTPFTCMYLESHHSGRVGKWTFYRSQGATGSERKQTLKNYSKWLASMMLSEVQNRWQIYKRLEYKVAAIGSTSFSTPGKSEVEPLSAQTVKSSPIARWNHTHWHHTLLIIFFLISPVEFPVPLSKFPIQGELGILQVAATTITLWIQPG